MLWFFAKLNTLAAIVATLAIFLVVDGFLFYRYQQLLQSAKSHAAQPAAQSTLVSAEEDPDSIEPGDQANTTTTEETTVSEGANVPLESREDEGSRLEQNPQASLPGGAVSDQEFGTQSKDAWAPPVTDEGQNPGFLDESSQITPFAPAPQE